MCATLVRGFAAMLVATVALTLAGCEKPAPTVLPPPDAVPEVNLDTPEDAARSALTLLRSELRAIAQQNEQAADDCLAKLRTLVAVQTIDQRLARLPQFKVVVGGDVIEGYLENWAAAVAYYTEGLHLEQMRRGAQSSTRAAVVVPASGPEDQALIQITCIREDDGLWRVSRMDFVTAFPASQPASQATSQAASQPS
jgi:predicted small lipoprotein YifL